MMAAVVVVVVAVVEEVSMSTGEKKMKLMIKTDTNGQYIHPKTTQLFTIVKSQVKIEIKSKT